MKTALRLCALFLTLTVLFPTNLSIASHADSFFTVEATDGDTSLLTNRDVKRYWRPSTESSQITLTLDASRKTDGIYISWYTNDTIFEIRSYDKSENVLDLIKNGDLYDGFSCFYPLNTATRKVVIDIPTPSDGRKDYGIGYLTLSDPDDKDDDIMKWTSPEEKCDLLMIPTHQDDEYIFLGAVLPTYISEGYKVAVAYSCVCTRGRYEEGLRGLWHCGLRTYPDYLGFIDQGRKLTFDEAADVWGGIDNVTLALVREIRRRQPTVVVTHDENGENYHNSHCVTSAAAKKAVKLAADPDYDPESLAKYGPWTVSKLYLHLYKENQISLDYTKPLPAYGEKTAYDVAVESYEFHISQHNSYKLTWSAIQKGGKYDNTLFGLAYSSVGIDNRDLFSGTDIWNGSSYSITEPHDPPTVTTAQRETPTAAPTTLTTTATEPTVTAEPTVTTEPIVVTTGPITTAAEPTVTTKPPITTDKLIDNNDKNDKNDNSNEKSKREYIIPLDAVTAILVLASSAALIILNKKKK